MTSPMRRSRRGTARGDVPGALREFLATETAGGVLLVVAAIAALIWANSPWQASYESFWHTEFGFNVGDQELRLDLRHWVNDGLMAVFFLVVGLEVKRELLLGELRDRRSAALPVFGALGGMVLPALIYAAVNLGENGTVLDGWGIPVATDIAFALGVLALVAPGVPSGVRLFLLTLAIVDDIGAIVLIAVFYSDTPDVAWLLAGAGIVATIIVLMRIGARATPLFGSLGLGLWLVLHASGVHATLAGVAMGLLAPAEAGSRRRIAGQLVSELEYLEHRLHGFSSLLIVPLFALANSGVVFSADGIGDAATSTVAIGVILGLVVGKTVGISAGAWLGIRLGLASLPDGVGWRHLMGAAALGGIGFTVSIFISNLAFDNDALVNEAKMGIFAASILATLLGTLILLPRRVSPEKVDLVTGT
jgi:Na+:H+ antiporter, NhaA family